MEPQPKRDVIVLVDFSGLAWTCWEPAVSAEEAGKKALEEHRATCASCELDDPCDARPKQYDARKVVLTNVNLKFGSIAEAIGTPVKTWMMVKDGRDKRRREWWPAYKANREQKPFDPRPLVEEFIRQDKRCPFYWSPEAEADDAIYTMAHDLVDSGFDVVVVSSDKDLWQLWAPPRVRIFLTTKNEFLTQEYMEKKLRVDSSKHVRLVKALWGDPSDNIPNAVPRMQAQLLPLVKSCDGDIYGFWVQAAVAFREGKLTKRCHELLIQNGQQVNTNWNVVGLYTVDIEDIAS